MLYVLRKEERATMANQRMPEMGKILLCGVQGCCPSIIDFTDSNAVVLKDDFGGQVQLTREQWADLKVKFVQKSDQD